MILIAHLPLASQAWSSSPAPGALCISSDGVLQIFLAPVAGVTSLADADSDSPSWRAMRVVGPGCVTGAYFHELGQNPDGRSAQYYVGSVLFCDLVTVVPMGYALSWICEGTMGTLSTSQKQ